MLLRKHEPLGKLTRPFQVRLEAFLNNGDRALSNTLELRTPDGARKGHHESAKRTLQIALLVIIVLGQSDAFICQKLFR